MDWKNLFKPTITKIILTILIFVIFVPFIDYDIGIRCITAPCPASAEGSILTWLTLSYNFYIYQIFYASLIVGAVLSYLISCLVIFTINKIKKK